MSLFGFLLIIQACLVFNAVTACPGDCGLGGHGYGAGLGAGCGAAYGGAGVGNVAVAGELPVRGITAISGQVPIIGCVQYGGPVCAAGCVTITGRCHRGCGCNGIY